MKEKQLQFLENYPKFLRATKTAEAIGINDCTHYDWLKKDEEYSRQFQELKKRIDSDRLEAVESEIYSRSFKEDAYGSSTLLMFQAKALNPAKYRDNPPETRLTGDITIKLAVPGYTDTPIQIEEKKTIEGEFKEIPDATEQEEKQG